MKKPFILFLGLLSLITILTGCQGGGMFIKEYDSSIYVGAPKEYPVIFGDGYLFTDGKSQRAYFKGMQAYSSWGFQRDAFGHGEYPLMKGIHLRWYSVAEDKFYEGEVLFDPELIQFLKSKQYPEFVDFGDKLNPLKNIDYTISVAPKGYVAVWGQFNKDTYLLTTFYAKPVVVDDFDWFIRRAMGYGSHISDTTRQDIYNDMIEVSDETGFRQTIQKKAQGIMPSELEYKTKTETRYHWQLKVKGPYAVERYRFRLADKQGFNYNAIIIDEGFAPKRASAPTYWNLSVINLSTKHRNWIELIIDEDEAVKAFNEMVAKVGDKALIEYEIEIKEVPDGLAVYPSLRSGDIKIDIPLSCRPIIQNYSADFADGVGLLDRYL